MIGQTCLVGVLLWTALPGVVAAQSDEVIPSRVFTARDGLPGDYVNSIAQTSDGLLWVGTSSGLAYFDGFRFRELAFPGSLGRVGVTSLTQATDNALWVTTSRHGVWKISGDLRLRKLAALGDESIQTVLIADSTTYFLQYTQAWALDGRSGVAHKLSYPYEVTTQAIARSAVDGVGTGPATAILAPDGRLVILDGVIGPRVFDPEGTAGVAAEHRGTWTSIDVDAEGRLWALDHNRGLFRLDQNLLPELVEASSGNHHLLIEGGIAYIAARSGVIRFDIAAGRRLEPLDRNVGLQTSDARLSFVDQQGSLWISTRSHLIHIPHLRVRHVKYGQDERLVNVGIIAPAFDGELWASSYGGGIVRLAPALRIEQPYESNLWTTVTASPDGQLLAIGNDGVARLEQGRWQPALAIPDAVRGVAGAGETVYIWKDDGAFRYSLRDGTRIELYAWPVDERSYHAIGSTPDGGVVIRAHDLVFRAIVDESTSTVTLDTLGRLEGVEHSGGWYLTQDHTGAVWIGFWDQGLVRMAHGVTTAVLPDVSVQRLNLSGDSLFIASTTAGLHAFDVASQRIVFSLHQEDGLISNATTGAAFLDGVLFVAHATGVSTLPVDLIGRPTAAPPRVHLSPIGDRAGAAGGIERLGRDASFRFFSTSYVNPGALSYEYRLGDGGWAAAEGNVLQFHRLGGGRHTLEVRARYDAGEPGPIASYAFSVATPYYEALWFRLLMLMGLALLAGFVYVARIQVLKRRAAALKDLVEERTWRLADAMRTTERQAELLRQHDELKTRFFTNISHEFRTPLTLIRGLVNDVVTGRRGPLAPDVEASLGVVAESTERLTRLVEDLLELSRLEAGMAVLRQQAGDVVGAVRACVRAHCPAAERAGVRMTADYQMEDYRAIFDAAALDRVVANLLSNAMKHTPPDGSVHLELSTMASDAGVVISVTDTGSGISQDLLPHIFDRFVLGEEEAGSSGIGLALVREIVDLQEGTIEVRTEVGSGSRFTVSLPLERTSFSGDGIASDDEPPEMALKKVVEAPAGVAEAVDAETILIVDDNADIRAYVASHLADRYHVREATDGVEAMEVARQANPALIISDVMMPRMSGDELCRQLRADESLADVPVILLTARAGGQGAVDGLEAGADAYVEKPFHMDALLARVERLLASRTALKDSYSRHMVIDGLEVEIDSAEEALLKQLFEIVDARMAETTFGVEDLAVEMGLSPRHLRRRIKQATGESPAELLRRYRLEVAARLLAGGAASVAEAGYCVGYSSPAAFGNQFKKQFGVNPSDYAATP